MPSPIFFLSSSVNRFFITHPHKENIFVEYVTNRGPQNWAKIDITYIFVEIESEITITHIKPNLFWLGQRQWVTKSFYMDKRAFCSAKHLKIEKLTVD